MNKNKEIAFLQKPSQKYFYILDIDSTLISTHQRNQAILKQFIMDYAKQFPEDCKNLLKAQCQLGDYGYHTTLKRIMFSPKHENVLSQLEHYWRQHFFSNFYLHHDVPMLGAVEWVNNLKKLDIDFYFLTARHHASMWSGTLESLTKLGFPISENNLLLKENLKVKDEDYKVNALEKLLKNYSDKEIIFIDNEPLVLHKVLEKFPQIKLVWFNSTHSGKKTPPEIAVDIKDFIF
jgi:hypothetical protein